MNKEFLIIGVTGLIGAAVSKELKDNHSWAGTVYSKGYDKYQTLDITNVTQVEEVFKKINPRYVINCANLAGGPNFCEANPDKAKAFHYESTKHLGGLCQKTGATIMYMSTDFVFDGSKENYTETDDTSPVNVYGQCKADSEMWLMNNVTNHIIVRTSCVYGWDPGTLTPNYMMAMHSSVSNGEKFFAPAVRFARPTYVRDLAKSLVELCLKEARGIFHVVGADYVSRFDWIKQCAKDLGWNHELIMPTNDFPQDKVRRPAKMNLSTDKFQSSYSTVLHDVTSALKLIKEEVKNNSI